MEEITLLDYIKLLKSRLFTILAVTFSVVLLAAAALMLMPRSYEGEARLIFPQQQNDDIGSKIAQISGIDILGSIGGFSGRDTYASVVKSRTISENVLRRLGLDRRCGLEYDDLQDNLGLETPTEGGMIITFTVPTSWLKGHTTKADIKAEAAELAATITNTYIHELRIYDRSNSLFMGKKNRLFIEDQLTKAKIDLSRAEKNLEIFQKNHPTLVPPEQGSVYADQALKLTTQQTEAEVAMHEAQQRLNAIRTTWKSGAPKGVSPKSMIDNPTISSLRKELAELEVKRAELLENLTENHPEVVSASERINKVNDRLRLEIDRVASGAAASMDPARQEILKQLVLSEITCDSLCARNSALSEVTGRIEKQASSLPAKEMQYMRLLRDLKTSETVYTTLLSEYAKARIEEGRDADNFIILDEAKAPKKPAKPRVLLTIAASVITGLILGVFTATTMGPRKR